MTGFLKNKIKLENVLFFFPKRIHMPITDDMQMNLF